jgi:3-oxoacyl-[acyl-carrier-protein] synthase II
VAGGTEACIHPITVAAFAAMRALSTRNDDPTHASRPYDLGRDGFVMGEGAGALVLESAEHAAARGARVYAEVASVGMTADGHHIAQPDPNGAGAARAMRLALQGAQVTAADVIHINAHATSTPQGDIAEATAIKSVLGDAVSNVAVSGTKSMTGHLLGGAGAVESVAAILALHNRIAPVTANLEDPDPEIGLDVVSGEPRRLRDGDAVVVNNSFGFGGHNVALVFRSV